MSDSNWTNSIPIVGPIIGLFGSLFGAHKQSQAADKAAKIQADATKYAADLTAKATADALAYQQSEANRDQSNFQTTQRANYGQYSARQRNINALGSIIGAPQREIPAFVDTTYQAPPAGSLAGAQQPSGAQPSASGDPIMDALTSNYASLGAKPTGPGSGPTDIGYFAQRIKETGGLTADNTKYWFGPQGRIAQELSKSGSATVNRPNGAPLGSIAASSYLPFQQAPRLTL